MMFDDYDVDYDDDDIDDEFLYDAGSDDDEYFMTRNGELVYAGDVYEDYYEYANHFAKSSHYSKNDYYKMEEAKNELETNNKLLVGDRMARFLNNPKHSDVTLKVGRTVYHAHKIILCSWSEVFRKMFIDPLWSSPRKGETNRPGPQQQVLVEPDECVKVFKDFLKFMYTETVELSAERVYPILTLADKYMVQDLRDACEDFLLEEVAHISGEEALKLYAEAERLGLERVQDQSIKVLEANIGYLPESCIQSMNADLLIRLLQSSKLLVEDEHAVCELAVQWLSVEGEQAERKVHAVEILSLIRFPHMPSKKLKSILDSSLPQDMENAYNSKLTEMIYKAFEWRALVAEEAHTAMEDDFVEPRIYLNQAFSLHNKGFSSMTQSDGEKFRKLTLYTEEQDDYYHSKLTFRASSATDKNIYKFGKSSWEVSAYSSKECDAWNINYTIRTSQELGQPYRVAVLTRLTDEGQDPIVTIHDGNTKEKFTLSVSSALLKLNEMPIKVWTKMAIFIGRKKSDPNAHIHVD
ncbi:BTB/POZ domain-containing protein 17-like [Asterias rubens]|uniref:BTB/POZ domain-containing protein 17-like n=1 Tax=Asterias rubens TaxID=7604 RepID=UPI001455A0EC|nr:BTB/POZ domain-containing protein 17-like [Asterias rubens]